MKKILFSLAATMLLVMGGLKAQDFVQVGVGDTTTYHLPSYFFYEYSCAQMTYYADDLIYAGLSDGEYIYGIAFNYTAGNAKQRYIRVYICSPTSSTFSNTNEWWDEDDMHLVYSGEYCVSAEAGWKTIWFETPYQYDGGNIGIAVYDYTAGDLFGQR